MKPLRTFAFLILAMVCLPATAQTLSPTAKISLLTCGPGEELYSSFGHSAVRVCDTAQKLDIVFNYGTFDFNAPNFYLNFVRGKLNYKLSVVNFGLFMFEYETSERWVVEQEFQLTHEEKEKVFAFLLHNRLPENCYYLYDFLFDNCTTRIRDLLENLFAEQLVFPNVPLEPAPSFRTMLHAYLTEMPWSELGIDIVDGLVAPRQYMFLPDYLLAATDGANIHGTALATPEAYLYVPETPPARKAFFTPMVVFALLFIAVLIAYFAKLPLKWFDFSWFLILGGLGLLLVFMWVGTDHWVTKENFNLLWALPLHAFAVFFLFKKQRPQWLLWYFAVNTLLCVALLLCWQLLPQQLNNALIFVVALSGFRSYTLAKPLLKAVGR